MPFDAPVVAGLAQEIQHFLPVKIARIYQPYPDEFHFSCYGGGETFALLFSLNPQYARFHLVPDNRNDSTVVSSFCLLLRKYFSGSRLTTIQALPFERLIKLTFEIYDPISDLNLNHIWV